MIKIKFNTNYIYDSYNKNFKGKDRTCKPVWFMRQAGRYLPEFRKIRKTNQDFINLCLNSNLIEKLHCNQYRDLI